MASAVDIGRSSDSPSASATPSPHLNAVAHEARVVATGARPSNNTRSRELFAEDTTSVLVFENGGVIRLSAAVVPGQLLFLTNQDTKREVIAQVTRKRANKPTSCYVELEFTQPSPGFWGIELPKTPQPAPPDSPQAEIAKLVQSAEATADDPGTPAPAPSANEVDNLVKEVEALRAQLKSLQEKQPAANIPPAPAAVAVPTPAPVPAETRAARPAPSMEVQPAKVQPVKTPPTVAPPVESVPVDAAPAVPQPHATSEPQFSEDDLLPKPALDFQKAPVAHKSSLRAQKKLPPPPKSGAPRALFLSATLIFVAAGAAWYMDWIPGLPPLRTPSTRTSANLIPPANPAHAPSSSQQKPAQLPVASSDAAQPSGTASATQAGAPAVNSSDTPTANAVPLAVPATQPASTADASLNSNAKEKPAALLSASKRSSLRSSTDPAPASTTLLLEGGPIIPPKLVKSVRPNAPRDAILGYVTGDVAVDATVDPSGHVNSVKVLSGPASLRNAAVNAVKQYRYEPATQYGKPVSAHVSVTIQFWFEP